MAVNKDALSKFSVVVYGDIHQYNQVLSQARCRIFYKGANRNGTYITDEFAENLISTLPYVPVKGIYDSMAGDYTDHGRERYEGRIYGVVPENPNFAWETHLDEDGVQREYACVDVLLFTGIYQKEALQIVGKQQSMELYKDSIEGDFQFINGQKYFVYTKGSFLGLQALGDNVEPCFEGAAFYSLFESLQGLLDQIKQFDLDSKKNKGGKEMTIEMFKISDNQKYNMIWSLLNPNFNEEGGWMMNYGIDCVYDDYALAYNIAEGRHERVYYTKNDATDSLELGEKEVAYIVDINEAEKTALTNLRVMNGETFENVDEKFSQIETLENEKVEFNQKIEEQKTTIATLTQEKENLGTELEQVKTSFTEASEENANLTNELEELKNFKHQIEVNEKNDVIDAYVDQLDAEVLNGFREKIDEFTQEELGKELAFALVKSKPSLFNNDPGNGFVPKDESTPTGIEAILSKYKK